MTTNSQLGFMSQTKLDNVGRNINLVMTSVFADVNKSTLHVEVDSPGINICTVVVYLHTGLGITQLSFSVDTSTNELTKPVYLMPDSSSACIPEFRLSLDVRENRRRIAEFERGMVALTRKATEAALQHVSDVRMAIGKIELMIVSGTLTQKPEKKSK